MTKREKAARDDPAAIARRVAHGGLVSGTISGPRPGAEFDSIRIRAVSLKSGLAWQLEERKGAKAFHRNVGADELESLLAPWLASGFSRAAFTLESGEIQVLANRRGELTALERGARPANRADGLSAANAVRAADGVHDRVKKRILEEGVPIPFLVELGIMTAEGAVVKAKYDKFRQINRFLEFIADILPELIAPEEGNARRELRIVDFGCGKSYLTFAVYHYLTALRGIPARIVGLDLKDDVIAECSRLAERSGYAGLSFKVGDIASYAGEGDIDMVISLHACDTATDFALAQAVRWGARAILAVPCCQHELAATLASPREPGAAATDSAREILKPAFRHGIVRERMAALLTDSLRAELLEARGYRVQILEFIDMSHTPKNLLIRAIRSKKAGNPPQTGPNGDYARLRDFLGARPTLERELFPSETIAKE